MISIFFQALQMLRLGADYKAKAAQLKKESLTWMLVTLAGAGARGTWYFLEDIEYCFKGHWGPAGEGDTEDQPSTKKQKIKEEFGKQSGAGVQQVTLGPSPFHNPALKKNDPESAQVMVYPVNADVTLQLHRILCDCNSYTLDSEQ